jgi:hypothetical protein
MNNKKIWIIGLAGVSIGAIIGRIIYLNYAEAKEAQQNFTPEAKYDITNGNPQILDSSNDYDRPLGQDIMNQGQANDSTYNQP